MTAPSARLRPRRPLVTPLPLVVQNLGDETGVVDVILILSVVLGHQRLYLLGAVLASEFSQPILHLIEIDSAGAIFIKELERTPQPESVSSASRSALLPDQLLDLLNSLLGYDRASISVRRFHFLTKSLRFVKVDRADVRWRESERAC